MATNMETRDKDYNQQDEQMELPNALKSDKQKITEYRELNETTVILINQAKEIAIRVGDVCEALERTADIDKRWLAIAKTDLQQGFMALVRSIAKPETF